MEVLGENGRGGLPWQRVYSLGRGSPYPSYAQRTLAARQDGKTYRFPASAFMLPEGLLQ